MIRRWLFCILLNLPIPVIPEEEEEERVSVDPMEGNEDGDLRTTGIEVDE